MTLGWTERGPPEASTMEAEGGLQADQPGPPGPLLMPLHLQLPPHQQADDNNNALIDMGGIHGIPVPIVGVVPPNRRDVYPLVGGEEGLMAAAAVVGLPLAPRVHQRRGNNALVQDMEDAGIPEDEAARMPLHVPIAREDAMEEGDEAGAAMAELPESDTELRKKMFEVCKAHLQGSWCLVSTEDMIVRRVSGGLSNSLYFCALPPNIGVVGDEPRRVLVRLYGPDHDGFQKLICESVIFALLSESQRGPRLFGLFKGGRVEEYIPARPLTRAQLADPRLSRLIAAKVAIIHSMQVPVNKEPHWLWETMERYVFAVEKYAQQHEKSDRKSVLPPNVLVCQLREEMQFLRNYLEGVQSPVVFSHNDLQEGNILYRKGGAESSPNDEEPHPEVGDDEPMALAGPSSEPEEHLRSRHSAIMHECPENRGDADHQSGGVDQDGAQEQPQGTGGTSPRGPRGYCNVCNRLFPPRTNTSDRQDAIIIIDFEYAAYNYRGFDFANHMCEWMYDYTNETAPYYFYVPDGFPSRAQQEVFVRAYLESMHTQPLSPDAMEDEVENILFEIKAFSLASHFFWALWALFNSIGSTITFDYWGYGDARLKAYFRLKRDLLSQLSLASDDDMDEAQCDGCHDDQDGGTFEGDQEADLDLDQDLEECDQNGKQGLQHSDNQDDKPDVSQDDNEDGNQNGNQDGNQDGKQDGDHDGKEDGNQESNQDSNQDGTQDGIQRSSQDDDHQDSNEASDQNSDQNGDQNGDKSRDQGEKADDEKDDDQDDKKDDDQDEDEDKDDKIAVGLGKMKSAKPEPFARPVVGHSGDPPNLFGQRG